MATPIANKVQQLRNKNFDLGAIITGEVSVGYGGKKQEFQNATIYYHPVMGSEAKEVHGGIRTKYHAMGGFDTNAQWGKRLFGFPMSDEEASMDGRCQLSRFEWGIIYWLYGAVSVNGKIYGAYVASGREKGRFGYPVSDPINIGDGELQFFELGCMYCGKRSFDTVVEMDYSFPQLGNPWMINPADIAGKEVIRFVFHKSRMNFNIAGQLFQSIFNGRLFLRQVGTKAEVPLQFRQEDAKQAPFNGDIHRFSSTLRLGENQTLKNRCLYDVVLKLPNGNSYVISAHSVYARNDWKDFKFIHATDVHISRRVDGFRKFFRDRSMHDAVRNFNNFNDNFRQLIKYANTLYSKGELDFIMITGDLVDYVFEDGGKTYHTNNFVYFENIVRGLTGKPDEVQNEELRVPIFTSLGNHDYRIRPYYPLFTVDIGNYPDKTIEQFGSFNLTKDEAKVLTEFILPGSKVSQDTAIGMIKPDRNNSGGNLNYYFRYICRETSYTVPLGKHRLVMIDGKWDDGTIEGTMDAIKYYLGMKGEASDNFVGGSPDSVGFVASEFEMVSRALQQEGLVIIGVHEPLINPHGGEYSYYLRENIRLLNPAAYKNEMRRYLFRRDSKAFLQPLSQMLVTVDLTRNEHPGWLRERTFYFHEGNGDDLLDYGVMRGYQADFLKLCAGVKGSSRPADLVLSGHVHKNFECRLMWDGSSQKFKISHDFYTENPSAYYHSYDMDLIADKKFSTTNAKLASILKNGTKRIHVSVADSAGNVPVPVKNASGVWSVATKPYSLTLASQKDGARRAWWWQQMRPLLVQTAALGPSEFLRAPEHQPDFRGCRYISVTADVIEKVQYVKHEQIKSYQPFDWVVDRDAVRGGGVVVRQ